MKKVFAIIMAVMLVAVSFSALAAGSKTTNDVNNVKVDEKVAVVVEIVDPSEAVTALIEKLTAGDAEVVPADAANATLTEVLAVVAKNVEEGVGNVTAVLAPTTVFEKDQKVSVFMGVPSEEKVEWEAVTPVTVNDEGALELTFTEAQLMTMQNVADVVLAIFVAAAE